MNADESEPGTFKDREIMLRNPHALIEGVLIMSYAIGATSAFIYIRGEYRTEFEVLRRALDDARSRGYVGLNVLGSGYNATVVLHRGAGAYICGEETALLSSLEGERGQPRSKPPFPAVAGLYAAPTLVNNVETLASVPFILEMGAEAYAAIGHRAVEGHARLLALGERAPPGELRAAAHLDAARPDRGPRRRGARGADDQGDHPGRLLHADPARPTSSTRASTTSRSPRPGRWPARARSS